MNIGLTNATAQHKPSSRPPARQTQHSTIRVNLRINKRIQNIGDIIINTSKSATTTMLALPANLTFLYHFEALLEISLVIALIKCNAAKTLSKLSSVRRALDRFALLLDSLIGLEGLYPVSPPYWGRTCTPDGGRRR